METMKLNRIILDRTAFVSTAGDLAGGAISLKRSRIWVSSTRPVVSFNNIYNIVIHN